MSRIATTLKVSLTVAAGLLVQTGRKQAVAPQVQHVVSSALVHGESEVGKSEVGEGPWIASCRYWAAARIHKVAGQPDRCDPGQTEPVPGVAGDAPEASLAAWGIPTQADGNLDVTTMLAVVPDPVHSGLALDFDRTVDAILLAAADNRYLNSHYWLPWQQQPTADKQDAGDTGQARTASERLKQRQPGLIVLRYAPDASEWPSSEPAPGETPNQQHARLLRESDDRNAFAGNAYRRVIYLFLVAETPALGVDGEQLQRALQYESMLRTGYGAHLSLHGEQPVASTTAPAGSTTPTTASKPLSGGAQGPATTSVVSTGSAPGNTDPRNTDTRNTDTRSGKDQLPQTRELLSVIGPSFSGSAASLHAGIEAALPQLGYPKLSITGATGTTVALHELDPENAGTYRSFGEDNRFEQERFLEALVAARYDLSRVAVLSEAGTVFGTTTKPFRTSPRGRRWGDEAREKRDPAGRKDEPASRKDGEPNAAGACVQGHAGCYRLDVDQPLDQAGTILNLRFPRELSVLRNAAARDAKAGADPKPTPYLDLSLKNDDADDTVKRFSATQSPLSIEAQLMAIANQLNRARSQFILISASNALDDLFLAQFLHRACPDARIVLFSGGDLLFERDGENGPYVGSLSLSPYLLSSLSFGERPQWLHADYRSDQM